MFFLFVIFANGGFVSDLFAMASPTVVSTRLVWVNKQNWVAEGGKVRSNLPAALGEIFLLTIDEIFMDNFDVREVHFSNYSKEYIYIYIYM